MKFLIVFVALFAVAMARPDKEVQILKQDSDVGPESFVTRTELDDKTVIESSGQLNNIGTDHESIVIKGSFSYVGPDGVTYTVNYIADENGFQPQGAHLPVAA